MIQSFSLTNVLLFILSEYCDFVVNEQIERQTFCLNTNQKRQTNLHTLHAYSFDSIKGLRRPLKAVFQSVKSAPGRNLL